MNLEFLKTNIVPIFCVIFAIVALFVNPELAPMGLIAAGAIKFLS